MCGFLKTNLLQYFGDFLMQTIWLVKVFMKNLLKVGLCVSKLFSCMQIKALHMLKKITNF